MLRFTVPSLIFGVLVVFLYIGLGQDPKLVPSPYVGKPAPTLDLPALSASQRHVTNRDLLGKPVLLNVWASWCVACREEHAVLLRIAKELDLTLIGMDYKDKPEDAEAWLQHFGNPYQTVLSDRDGRAGINWGVYGVPETFLIDSKGTVAYKHVGPLTWTVVMDKLVPLAGPSVKPDGKQP